MALMNVYFAQQSNAIAPKSIHPIWLKSDNILLLLGPSTILRNGNETIKINLFSANKFNKIMNLQVTCASRTC